jgi:hypothetical protein
MSRNLKHCMSKLKIIAQIKDPNLRKKVLLNLGDDCLYKALNEIAINTVKNKVPLTLKLKKKLRPYKSKIQKLACYTKDRRNKKRLIVQSGGFLPLLLPAVVTALGGILPEIIKKI